MKAVMFDFDGTLTCGSESIWKTIWDTLNIGKKEGVTKQTLFDMYHQGKITYQQWVDMTCECFRKGGFSYNELKKLSKQAQLIGGLKETLSILKSKGYSLHIISGGVVQSINIGLGDCAKYFDNVSASDFIFDNKGILSKIISTNFDYEGKARYITEFSKKSGIPISEICFVGNSSNDEYAYLSGCKTICINPENADITNRKKWNVVFPIVKDLRDILDEIEKDNKNQEKCINEN